MERYFHQLLLVMAVTLLSIEFVHPTKENIGRDQDSTKLKYPHETTWKEEGFNHHRIRPRMIFKDSSSDVPKWLGKPRFIIKYELDGITSSFSLLMNLALEVFEKHTCLQFTQSTPESKEYQEFPHITFKSHETDCRVKKMDHQMVVFLNQSEENCVNKHTLLRFLVTSIGGYRPLYRSDRDSYLTINFENMNHYALFAYEKVILPSLSGNIEIPLDYTSLMMDINNGLMHSKNNRTTFATKDIKYQGLLGRYNKELSHRDLLSLNTQFGCLDYWQEKCRKETNPCQNEGFLKEDCSCACRPGTDGENCESVNHEDYYGHLLPKCSVDINLKPSQKLATLSEKLEPDGWCVYKIRPPANHVIEINFTKSHLTEEETCNNGYIEIREEGAFQGKTACGNYTSIHYKSKKEKGLDIYVDSRSSTTTEFQAKVTLENLDSSNINVTSLNINVTSSSIRMKLSYIIVRLFVTTQLLLLCHEMI